MCTDYNDGVGRYAICYILAILAISSCLKGSSTPAYKGAWRGHHGGSGADTIWNPRLSPMRVLQGNLPWACLRIRHKLLRPVIRHGMATLNLP
jgi:hypothetical protein